MKTVFLWVLVVYFPASASAQFSLGLTGALNLPQADFRAFVRAAPSVELNGQYLLNRHFFLDASLSYASFGLKKNVYSYQAEFSTIEVALGSRRWEYYGFAFGGGYYFLPDNFLNPSIGLDVGYMVGYREMKKVEEYGGFVRTLMVSGPLSYATITPKIGLSVLLSDRFRLEPSVRYNFNFKGTFTNSRMIVGSTGPRRDLFLQLAVGLYARLH